MKNLRFFGVMFLAIVLALALVVPVSANSGPSITPSEVDEVIYPGDSIEVTKEVQTPVITPKPDILFLADTTESMGAPIANVQANATVIMNAVLAAAPDAEFGVANYKDYPYDPYVTLWQQQMTADTTLVQDAIDDWVASGGVDWPEGWFASLDRAVNPAAPGNPGWRSDSTKIIVLFGDAPAHDPVPSELTGLPDDITEASLTADLVAAGIKMVFISLETAYPEGLNLDPTTAAIDYQTVVPGYVPGGAAGQANRIAAATGGVSLDAPTAEDVADYILAGLTALPVTVSMTSDCAGYITTSFEPESQVVTSGDVAIFTETISVAADTPGGLYECRDWVLLDGEPMVDEAGDIIYETKTIRIPLVEVEKHWSMTDVCFRQDNDGDGLYDEDPINYELVDTDGDGVGDTMVPMDPGIDDDRDGLIDEDPVECDGEYSLGTPLDMEGDSYILQAVVKKNGRVSSYNPGQFYAVSTVEVLHDVETLTITEDFSDCAGIAELNPKKGGGKVVVVWMDGDVPVQILDAKDPEVTVDEAAGIATVELEDVSVGIYMVYVKFAPGLTDIEDNPEEPCVNYNGAVASIGDYEFGNEDSALIKVIE